MMVIDIKKGLLFLCSLKDALSVLDLKLKNSEIIPIEKDKIAMKIIENELVKDKPNLSIFLKDICYTFWFYDLNAKKSALMCIQRVQKPNKIKKQSLAKLIFCFAFVMLYDYHGILCLC